MVEMKEEYMSDFTLGTFGLSIQTGQIFFLALETYTTFFNEGIDKQKTKRKKNIHMIIITTTIFDLFLRHDRMVTSKDTTLTMHSSDCPYILYHVTPRTRRNQLAYIYLAKVCRLY